MADLFKYLIAALAVFLAYNEFVMMHHPSAFNDITLHEAKADVVHATGEPKHVYQCAGHQPPLAFLMYIDKLCIDKVEEVDAFPLCYIPMRCPGWDYVAFDKDGKVVAKYHLGK